MGHGLASHLGGVEKPGWYEAQVSLEAKISKCKLTQSVDLNTVRLVLNTLYNNEVKCKILLRKNVSLCSCSDIYSYIARY